MEPARIDVPVAAKAEAEIIPSADYLQLALCFIIACISPCIRSYISHFHTILGTYGESPTKMGFD